MQREEEYFLGVFLGDGNASSKNRIDIFVGSAEKEWLSIVVRVIEDVFFIQPKVYKQHSWLYRVAIHSSVLWNQYKEFKRKGVWYLPKIEHPAFLLAGIFDTDGSVSFGLRDRGYKGDYYRVLNFYSAYQRNIEIIQNLLDYPTRFYKKINSGFGAGREMFTLYVQSRKGFEYIRNEIPIKHPRKREVLNELLESYK